ncbi:MAG: BBP7 family outer membrane beta-barrel protein [Planctomycetota bacterium]
MKVNILRGLAATLGISVCGVAHAQYTPQLYSQPAPIVNTGQAYASAAQTLVPTAQNPVPTSQALAQQVPSAQLQVPVASPQPFAQPSAQANVFGQPSRWNSFHPKALPDTTSQQPASATLFMPASTGTLPAPPMPTPAAMPTPMIQDTMSAPVPHVGMPTPAPAQNHVHAPGVPCTTCGPQNAYTQAMSAPWEGSAAACGTGACGPAAAAPRAQLYPWYGGANLLFLSLQDSAPKTVATIAGANSVLSSGVDPGSDVGFDVTFGRYLDCGRYGLGLTYFNWDPSAESRIYTGTATSVRAHNPGYNDILIDMPGAGAAESVYDHITGASTDSAGAVNVRLNRDIGFQGIELNLASFGLMGAQRATPTCQDGSGRLLGHLFPGKHNACSPYGYGGAAGPLVRPCHGRLQVVTTHGFRWFQVEDEFEVAYNVDGNAGYQADDIYDESDVENNLFGYQFGGRLFYCLSNRLNFHLGGKFGVYGNDIESRHFLGTRNYTAYQAAGARFTDDIDTTTSDTSIATLGELDLGLGYRINNAWTVRGGYRVLGVTGIATAVDQQARDYSSVATSGAIHADSSLVLTGGYVGLDFNW